MPNSKTKVMVAVALILIGLIGTLLWSIFRLGITERNGRRIADGMTQAQVESILGPPNSLPAVTVWYDADEKVKSKKIATFWRIPPWR
jgi:hypothetical protein